MDYKALIREVPDFPKPGIGFKDITTLTLDPDGLVESSKNLAAHFRNQPVDLIAGVESRGFIFGALVAAELKAGFIPVRKPGKLPAETISVSYELEYGSGSLCMHMDAIRSGQSVLVVDDLLATGGTLRATCDLIELLGGKVAGVAVVVELTFLNGRKKLSEYEVFSLVQYDSE